MASVKFININEDFNDVCKNKWRWAWLKEIDKNNKLFSDWCRKISESGFCFCLLCGQKINYGNNGKKALHKHSNDPEHLKRFKAQDLTCTLPGADPISAPASLSDRIADQKAVVTAFLAENCLPFSLAPKLVDLAKHLSQDKKALTKLKMSRTSATYITTHGTAKCMREELSDKLRNSFFSMNVDEATNNATDKLVNVMVRFYDEEQKMVVTDFLGSRKENLATAQNIFSNVTELMSECKLSYNNVVSCLLDNCSTMRGTKKGVETLVRKENENLLDIHGDIVHIMSNSAKKFFSHFDNVIENFVSAVYYDIQDSPKAKALFSDIQNLLNFDQPRQLLRHIESRFLQISVVCERIYALCEALFVYYYSFLNEDEQKRNEDNLNKIFIARSVTNEQRKHIKQLQTYVSKMNLTAAGKNRKETIMSIMFEQAEKFNFYLDFYRGILPHFNNFIKTFQSEKPLLHLVHSKIFSICKDFLSLFIKPEFLPKFQVKKLLEIDVNDISKQFSNEYLNVGCYAYPKVKTMRCHWMKHFYKLLRNAYMSTASYMLEKLPVTNKVLTYLTALDPTQRKQSTTITAFDKLSLLLPNVIENANRGTLLDECRQYTVDVDIDELEKLNVYTENGRIDYNWWSHIFEIKNSDGELKFKYLTHLVKAILTIFSGPLIEGTFNIMDDIITNDRSALTVENYEALSIIKYNLRRRKISSVDLKPDSTMRNAIHKSYNVYQNFLNKKSKVTLKSRKKPKKQVCEPKETLSNNVKHKTVINHGEFKKNNLKEVVSKNIPKKQDNQVVTTTITSFADNNLNSGVKQNLASSTQLPTRNEEANKSTQSPLSQVASNASVPANHTRKFTKLKSPKITNFFIKK